MGETTHISWADGTFSPWTGCTKISPACDGCYAAHLMDTRMGRVEWGEASVGEGTRALMSDDYWRKPLTWNRQAAKSGVTPWIFPSLCDPFDTAVPPQWRWHFFDLMEATPNILWLLLTKRIGNVRKLTDPLRGERVLPRNVALGGTFANQEEWDRDGHKLRDAQIATGARFTFGSFEPMLGPIDFGGGWMPAWVVAGGETDQGSHKARPSSIRWFRSLRDQCADMGVPFHFKQWGEWVGGEVYSVGDQGGFARHQDGKPHPGKPDHWWSGGAFGGVISTRIGKKAAGRALDGVVHDARPEVAA